MSRFCVGGWMRLCLTAVLISMGPAAHATLAFLTPVVYPVTSADYVTAVDLDRDGKMDIIGAVQSGGVFVVYGKGDGTFEPAVYYPVGAPTYEVAAADFNSDGRLDLVACAQGTDAVGVLLSDGPRSFGPRVYYATGTSPFGVTTGDVNEDGKPDIVAANASGSLSILIGNGDGTFQPKRDLACGLANSGMITDVNHDGHVDIVAASGTGALVVYLGDGTGAFTGAFVYPTQNGANGLMAADFDNDGWIDFATSNYWSSTSTVFLNDRTGKFSARVPIAAGSFPHVGRAADIDMDGWPDLVIPNAGTPAFNVQRNLGGGNMADPAYFFGPGGDSRSVAVGDFDGDGRPDVAVGDAFYNGGAVIVFLNRSVVTEGSVALVSVGPSSVYGGGVTKGTVTLSAAAPAGGLVVTLSSGNPAASTPAVVSIPAGATSATFPIATPGVAVKTTAVIRAQLGASFRAASVYVYPSIPSTITYSPNPVRGGKPVTATLALSGRAGPGGNVVTLTSMTPDVLTPDVSSVTVPAGKSSVTFPVTTYPVGALTTGVIKATGNGSSIPIGLKVYPAAPMTITFNPKLAYGGWAVTGTLTLTSPAPTGGLSVTLTAQDPALLTVPANVTVPAGQTSVDFPVQTHGVANLTLAVIVATANGESIYYGIRLYPAVPLKIVYSANPVKGGLPVTATLTLNGAAPPGGLAVALLPLNPTLATCGPSVTVPEGQSVANFQVSTMKVSALTMAVFKAAANGVSIYIGLRIAP